MPQRGFAFLLQIKHSRALLGRQHLFGRAALPFLCAAASLFSWLLISCLYFQVQSPATGPRLVKPIDAIRIQFTVNDIIEAIS